MEGGDDEEEPAEANGARRTSAKLKHFAAVISSRLAGESPVSFALFSAIKARKLQAPIFCEAAGVHCGQGRAGADPGGQAQS